MLLARQESSFPGLAPQDLQTLRNVGLFAPHLAQKAKTPDLRNLWSNSLSVIVADSNYQLFEPSSISPLGEVGANRSRDPPTSIAIPAFLYS
jgi:hypothetical protein